MEVLRRFFSHVEEMGKHWYIAMSLQTPNRNLADSPFAFGLLSTLYHRAEQAKPEGGPSG